MERLRPSKHFPRLENNTPLDGVEGTLEVILQFCRSLKTRINQFGDGKRTIFDILEQKVEFQSELIGQEPEIFMKNQLIRPLLENFGYTYVSEPQVKKIYTSNESRPDFRLLSPKNKDRIIIGEVKKIGSINSAVLQLKNSYLKTLNKGDFGIATDGVCWKLYHNTGDEIVRTRPGHAYIKRILHNVRKSVIYESYNENTEFSVKIGTSIT